MTKKSDDPVENAIELLKPVLSQLSFGSIMGYCSGYAAKKIGRALAFVLGMGFVVIQSASYAGYVNVDWVKVKNDALKRIDSDGDGEIIVDDVKHYWRKIRKVLVHNSASEAGFSLGFLYGVKHG